MEKETSESLLVMVFGDSLGIGLAPKSLSNKFRIGAVVYECSDPNFLTAFVDRLVDDEARLVGFYITPVSETAHNVATAMPPRPYLRRVNGDLEVWVSEGPLSTAHNAADQAFGGSVFLGSDNTVAMTIDTSGLLTRRDVESLVDANAVHVAVES